MLKCIENHQVEGSSPENLANSFDHENTFLQAILQDYEPEKCTLENIVIEKDECIKMGGNTINVSTQTGVPKEKNQGDLFSLRMDLWF